MNNFPQHPVKYDSKWPQYFLELSEQIKSTLGKNLVNIHHIGSTAIPGLMSKPIIDMLGEVENIEQVTEAKVKMEALGFEFKGEYGISERAYFSKKDAPAIHLHIFPKDHCQIEKHLIFRDYLIEHSSTPRHQINLPTISLKKLLTIQLNFSNKLNLLYLHPDNS